MTRKRDLSPEELALWSHVTRGVRAAKWSLPAQTQKADPAPDSKQSADAREPAPKSRPTAAPPKAASAPSPNTHPLHSIDLQTLERIKKGKRAIDARIDLHGMTQIVAHTALDHFIADALRRGARTLLIITGKGGRGSESQAGILKTEVPRWLRAGAFRDRISGVREAARAHGGSGAYYVTLKRERAGAKE